MDSPGAGLVCAAEAPVTSRLPAISHLPQAPLVSSACMLTRLFGPLSAGVIARLSWGPHLRACWRVCLGCGGLCTRRAAELAGA